MRAFPPHTPRILFVATSRSDGGIERYSVQMAAELVQSGVPLVFACRPDGPVQHLCQQFGVSAVPLHPRNSGDVLSAVRLAHIVKARAVDIVHVHSRRDFLPALVGVWMARRQGLPHLKLVLHAHMCRPLGTPAAWAAKVFARHVDLIVCVSDAVRCLLLRDGHLPLSKVRTLHNGVDAGRFAAPGSLVQQRERSVFRRQWEIAPAAVLLTMVGRLDAKGQQTLIDALPSLVARFPNLHVLLVGADGVAGERERLLARARVLGVSHKVTFTGPLDTVPQVLSASDVLVHLPTDEAFGLALTEAMAAGLPVVTANAGGCAEVVGDGVTGFVVAAHDSGALVQALERLLCGDGGKRLRSRMGAAGRENVRHSFLLSAQMHTLREVYTALCPVSPK